MTPPIDWMFGALGGGLIGLAAALLMAALGRIAGVSGIVGNLIDATREGATWRAAFVVGLILGPLLYAFLAGAATPVRITDDWVLLIAGGLLVGIGTRIGSGCTSGHGVCGLARLSGRAFTAVAIFFACALVTVYVMRHLIGGGGL